MAKYQKIYLFIDCMMMTALLGKSQRISKDIEKIHGLSKVVVTE